MNESTNTPRGTAAPGRLRTISDLGQSIWLDYIRRDLITSGDLGRMMEADGVEKFKKPFDHLMETLALRSARHAREDRP